MILAANNWVSDNANFLISTTLGILGVATGLFFYIRARRTRALEWEVLSNEAVAAATMAESVGLSMHWGERRLSHPRLMTVRLVNTGNEAITASQIFRPITLVVTDGELLSATVIGQPANDVVAVLPIEGGKSATLKIDLLNKREFFTVQLLLEAEDAWVDVKARIQDLTRPIGNLRLRRGYSGDLLAAWFQVLWLPLPLYSMYLIGQSIPNERSRVVLLVPIIGFLLFFGLFAYQLRIIAKVLRWRRRQREKL